MQSAHSIVYIYIYIVYIERKRRKGKADAYRSLPHTTLCRTLALRNGDPTSFNVMQQHQIIELHTHRVWSTHTQGESVHIHRNLCTFEHIAQVNYRDFGTFYLARTLVLLSSPSPFTSGLLELPKGGRVGKWAE